MIDLIPKFQVQLSTQRLFFFFARGKFAQGKMKKKKLIILGS